MDHSQRAYDLFMQGYNCSQSVFGAFCDLTGIDFELSLRLSSSFGGGVGRLREICGAVSGILMVAGVLYGYTVPADNSVKSEHYKRVQELAHRFAEENGAYVCRELLGLSGESHYVAEKRTDEYYKKRPCPELVRNAARLLDDFIKENEL